MIRQPVILFLLALLAFPSVQADDLYASISYGEVTAENDDVDDFDFDNIGFIIGGTRDGGGFGFELFLTVSTDQDDGINAYGFYAVYKTPGKYYFKGKAGLAAVDVPECDSSIISCDSTGLSYGAAVGMDVGLDSSVELSYLVLPELDVNVDRFDDEELDVEMISIHYYWNF